MTNLHKLQFLSQKGFNFTIDKKVKPHILLGKYK